MTLNKYAETWYRISCFHVEGLYHPKHHCSQSCNTHKYKYGVGWLHIIERRKLHSGFIVQQVLYSTKCTYNKISIQYLIFKRFKTQQNTWGFCIDKL